MRVPICLAVLDSSALQRGWEVMETVCEQVQEDFINHSAVCDPENPNYPKPSLLHGLRHGCGAKGAPNRSQMGGLLLIADSSWPSQASCSLQHPRNPPLPPLFNFTSTTTIPGWTHFYRPQYVYIKELFYRGVDESVYVMFVWSEWKWCCLV